MAEGLVLGIHNNSSPPIAKEYSPFVYPHHAGKVLEA